MPTTRLSIAASVGLCVTLLRPPTASAYDWLQFNGDAKHSGNNSREATIHAGNLAMLHVRYHVTLPGVADSAPVFLENVTTPQGAKDLLFLDTRDGTILAVEAATGAVIWSHQPATGPGTTTSSPAIDPARQFVYAYGLDGKIHKYGVGDGAEVTSGGWPEVATLKPDVESGISDLTIAQVQNGTTYLYAANGSVSGTGDYQGHLTTINLATGAQTVWNAACSDQTVHFVATPGTPDCAQTGNGIFAKGGLSYDSSLDQLFLGAGAGPFDADTGGHDWGESVLTLHADGTGAAGGAVDNFTPTDWQDLNTKQWDMGSNSPAILPVPAGSKYPHLAITSAKEAELHLLDLEDLSRQGGPGHQGGEVDYKLVPQGGGVVTALAVWTWPAEGSVWAFVVNDNGVSAMRLWIDNVGNASFYSPWSKTGNGGSSPLVVNGVLFYAGTAGLQALDPPTGNVLWSDASIGPIHRESPIVANGRLYITDENGVLWAYEPSPAFNFYTVSPCRVVDTRSSAGPYGAPALAGGQPRTFAMAGQCGVPVDAQAISANITISAPTDNGYLQVSPANVAVNTSTISFSAGQVRANNAVLALTGNPAGSVSVLAAMPGGASVELIIDVNGYFK